MASKQMDLVGFQNLIFGIWPKSELYLYFLAKKWGESHDFFASRSNFSWFFYQNNAKNIFLE